MIIPIILAVVLFIADQATKYMALTRLKPVGSVTFIEGRLSEYWTARSGCCLLWPL